jgi:hypothetical protein
VEERKEEEMALPSNFKREYEKIDSYEICCFFCSVL